jgi:hypothetical protein
MMMVGWSGEIGGLSRNRGKCGAQGGGAIVQDVSFAFTKLSAEHWCSPEIFSHVGQPMQ